MTFVYLTLMILVCVGIYKFYQSRTPEDERKTLFKKKEKQ